MVNEIKWSVDPIHSGIEFKVRHLMIANVKGVFKKFDASICTSGKDFSTACIDLWIDSASVGTGVSRRDEHLRSPDFFDAEHFKQILFSSLSIGKADTEGYQEMLGELTIKGITKKIKLVVQFGGILTDPWGNEKAGFSVTGKIKRSDWGLSWNTPVETGGLLVGEEVSILCELELTNLSEEEVTSEPELADKKVSL